MDPPLWAYIPLLCTGCEKRYALQLWWVFNRLPLDLFRPAGLRNPVALMLFCTSYEENQLANCGMQSLAFAIDASCGRERKPTVMKDGEIKYIVEPGSVTHGIVVPRHAHCGTGGRCVAESMFLRPVRFLMVICVRFPLLVQGKLS